MKKLKFKAIQRELWIPDNYHFCDLGESDNFREFLYRFHKYEFKIPEDQLAKLLSSPKLETAKGLCERWDSYTEQSSKHAFILYRTKNWDFGEGIDGLAGHWYARGHEECHVLTFFDLDNVIEEMIGEYDKSSEQAFADLVGLYAVDKRNLGNLISPEKREEFERAKIQKEK